MSATNERLDRLAQTISEDQPVAREDRLWMMRLLRFVADAPCDNIEARGEPCEMFYGHTRKRWCWPCRFQAEGNQG